MTQHLFLLIAIILPVVLSQSDPAATPQAKQLFNKLRGLNKGNFIFGSEMPTTYSFKAGFKTSFDQSDCKDVVGDHPGLFGFDFHYILYKDPNEAAGHKKAVARALESGAVVSWDFHMFDAGGKDYSRKSDSISTVKNIINPNDKSGKRKWFLGELDRIIAIFKSFPGSGMIYRPFHEMNGDWFWWGKQNVNDYIALFRLTVDYIRKQKNVHNLLVAWSPNDPYPGNLDFWQYYPGNNYVDIIGADIYEPGPNFIKLVTNLTGSAERAGKIAALCEIGTRNTEKASKSILTQSYSTFWTEQVLKPILNNPQAKKIAYMQTWMNNNWEGEKMLGGKYPYIPYAGMTGPAVADFKKFFNSPNTYFLKETAAYMRGAPIPNSRAPANADNSATFHRESGNDFSSGSVLAVTIVVGAIIVVALIAVTVSLAKKANTSVEKP